jgi:hypothetical protein
MARAASLLQPGSANGNRSRCGGHINSSEQPACVPQVHLPRLHELCPLRRGEFDP